ncbi:4-hydroxy-tetrahydrodipicolinate reductase [Liquorilactobacillus mali]|uniref:4-hydroxy-tetrahydrodipicolinate reductase n=1 Tax=Liquorilactobacillus mali KCTC 3596 = DSM 20444 TaxID=1046596 RepID=J1F1S6_9LACO|nr:4-hydroxy-tetrahydrodipicolinate reductase [Liquorilactobacillus mali]EJE98468.1 dihydrodipicolinate reductase [Liquorilactobacillus mali KCTC 3596 = DSM 20444]KRN08576.1 dihydrodipicolinate reductase [Liquorilactobacillus mali KCTC 3596 = DSM 20444]MDC7952170.1 4-hydroxy-tetrahydrodipicolinate reductase [Liquorilactobacillus mali]MDV7756901.1 4-hydroxy-tetrahydrodipicolinate reductase [Liquorilactobacillus mali]QFQ74741.1 4-hydroxy-tetrahydrodipicolinate reductase [Liquorilactobacillus mal
MVKILVAGFKGRMGNTTTKMVLENADFELTGVYDPNASEKNLNELSDFKNEDVPAYTKLADIDVNSIDVWIDFTSPASVYENAKFALLHDISPVIGTTGLADDQVAELKEIAKKNKVGGLIAPNFGISAVLLMQFAQQAAKYFPDVEIIEMHHDKKLDAPSGTALNTAKLISEVRKQKIQGNPEEKESLIGARGADYEGMRIHSVRLPGYVAHEQVLFGGQGEALTIRQDSFDRISFMSGVAVAAKKIGDYDELLVGLENLL